MANSSLGISSSKIGQRSKRGNDGSIKYSIIPTHPYTVIMLTYVFLNLVCYMNWLIHEQQNNVCCNQCFSYSSKYDCKFVKSWQFTSVCYYVFLNDERLNVILHN